MEAFGIGTLRVVILLVIWPGNISTYSTYSLFRNRPEVVVIYFFFIFYLIFLHSLRLPYRVKMENYFTFEIVFYRA